MSSISYAEMLEAMSNGKYSADRIATICSRTGMSAEEVYNTLYYTDNVSFFRTADGSVKAIQASTEQAARALDAGQAGLSPQAQQLIQELNSNNVASGTNIGTNVKTPMNTFIDPTTGKVKFDTEIAHIGGRSITDGKFSVQNVGLAIAAAGVGIKLGKTIDSVLYESNPDFFDSITWGDFNPEHWDSITADIGEDDPWYVRTAGRAFNAIFGLGVDRPNNPNNMQMYLDEDTLAYMVMGLVNKSVFDRADPSSQVETSMLKRPAYYNQPIIFLPFPYTLEYTDAYGLEQYVYSGDGYTVLFKTANNYYYRAIVSDAANLNYKWYRNGELRQNSTISQMLYTSTLSGASAYIDGFTQLSLSDTLQAYLTNFSSYINNLTVDANTFANTLGDVSQDLCTFFQGKQGGTVIDGIGDQEGATIFNPDNIDLDDTAAVISALRSQFPDLFNDDTGIEQKVIDEEGNDQTITYYPVPIPHINPDNLQQPTGGEDYGTQADPIVDPNTYPQDLLETITNLLLRDPVDNPNLPDNGDGNTPIVTPPAGSATALWSIYNPTQAQIDAFGAWLWSSDFVNQLKKIFNDPMESIISLHKVFGTPATGGTQNIAVGYLNSGVSSKVVTAQYTDVDCGSVQLSEYFGNVYDYKDTSVELYLPFIGIVPLSVSDVMRATIHVVYHIDVLTGACLADVEVTRDAGAGGVLYQYSGDCAVHYPVSAASYMGVVTGVLTIAGGIAGTIATHGAAAPALLGATAGATRLHTDVARSGGFSGNPGAMGAKVPYLIISRPQTALPENYLDIEGIGSNKTVMLNTCAGYTRIKEVYLQGIGDATEGELNELETLLKAGVIFPITETPPNE